jgi:GT2 family glycosyltransferase
MASELASIIIPVFNKLSYTKLCLESILHTTRHPYELIIVDDGSTDDTANYLGTLDKTKVITNTRNLGVPKAYNIGIRASRGRYIVILNNDTIVTPNWLSRMVQCAERHDRIGIIAPVTNFDSDVQQDENARYSRITELYDYAEIRARKFAGAFFLYPRVCGLSMLIKRETLSQVGLFDEKFSPGYYEDDDFCVRTLLAGFDIAIAQDVFIHHFGSKTFGSRRYRDALERNKRVFQEKWGPTPYDDALMKKFHDGNQTPLVSVILPTYNRPESLEEAVASVLCQTYQQFELIVTNDGGTDVLPIVRKFGDNRISHISSERHVGTAAARNLGLIHAKGEFVAYLDDDCVYYKNHLETLVAALTTTSCAVAYSNWRRAMQEVGIQDTSTSELRYNKERLLAINYIPISSVMHERRLLGKIGVFDETLRYHADWDLLIRLAQHAFFYHSGKTTLELRAGVEEYGFEAKNEIYRKYQDVSVSPQVRRARQFLFLADRFRIDKMKTLLSICHRAMTAAPRLSIFASEHVIPSHLRGLGLFAMMKRRLKQDQVR